MRALVVDDSRGMRMILRHLLTEIGCETAEAAGGAEGLQRLQELGRPDVVLVDWHMPDMDGLTFVRAVRATASCEGVRLVIVTAEEDQAYAAAARQAGADAFLAKPPSREALAASLPRPA
ncbi:MAG TPA: response regulator [Gemmataceae bacterium]|nr:response regulator [Gemmataceae bacterium]